VNLSASFDGEGDMVGAARVPSRDGILKMAVLGRRDGDRGGGLVDNHNSADTNVSRLGSSVVSQLSTCTVR